MPQAYSKAAYLGELKRVVLDHHVNIYHSQEQMRFGVFDELRSFIGYINGRLLDVLDGRQPDQNAYAAAYTLYADDVTANYPEPTVDPKTSVRELQEDIEKVDKIKSIAGWRPVDGLRGIDKATFRAVTTITHNEADNTITLGFDDTKREPIIIRIIPASVLVELTHDSDITAQKVIDFFASDEFAIRTEIIAETLLPKIPSSEIKPILDWMETVKLSNMYERKFNTLLIRDLLQRRYLAEQTGIPESDSTDIVEAPDRKAAVREFLFDFVEFLDRIGSGGGETDPAAVSLPDSPRLPPGGGTDVPSSGTELSLVRSIDTPNPLPKRISDDVLDRAITDPCNTRDGLLSYFYRFVHRIPAEQQGAIVAFYERAIDLLRLFPTEELTEPQYNQDIGVKILAPVTHIIRRMFNTVSFQAMIKGRLKHPDQTGGFDVDQMIVAPGPFASNTASDLATTLCYSWYSGDDLASEQYKMRALIEQLIPEVKEQVKSGAFSRHALEQQASKALEEGSKE